MKKAAGFDMNIWLVTAATNFLFLVFWLHSVHSRKWTDDEHGELVDGWEVG